MPDSPEPPRSQADDLTDPVRYAPHLLFIRMAERVDEAMASGRDPLPAFRAWRSALAPWARKDPQYRIEAALLRKRLRAKYRRYGGLPHILIVEKWREVYFGVMLRAGMFPRMDTTTARDRPPANTSISATRRSVGP